MSDTIFRMRSHFMLEGGSGQDDPILIDGHTGAMWSCNGTAAPLLESLRDGADRDGLAAHLVARFGIPRDAAHRDVREFLDGLSAIAAIEIVDDAGEGAVTTTRPAGLVTYPA
jgi:hypothetical protein